MSIWPEDHAIRACIDWNAAMANQAMRDSSDRYVTVPVNAVKRLFGEGKVLTVRLTADEYRAVRAKDEKRHRANIVQLQERVERLAA